MDWIRSAGGPLICIERKWAQFWFGVDGSNEPEGVTTGLSDYDRACLVVDYLGVIDISGRHALILGDMPLATTIWKTASEDALIVRAFYMDSDSSLPFFLNDVSKLNFEDPIESFSAYIEFGHLTIFDSAAIGADKEIVQISFDIPQGNYRLLTKIFEPDSRTSLLVHKFERNVLSV